MNKPKVLGSLETLQEEPQENPSSTGKDVATSAAGAGGVILAENLIAKAGGFHNSDIMKALEELQKRQTAISPSEPETLNLLRLIYKRLLEQKNNENEWMKNIQ